MIIMPCLKEIVRFIDDYNHAMFERNCGGGEGGGFVDDYNHAMFERNWGAEKSPNKLALTRNQAKWNEYEVFTPTSANCIFPPNCLNTQQDNGHQSFLHVPIIWNEGQGH